MVGPESREFGADRNKLDKIFCLKAYREGADPSYPELQADTFQDVFKAIGVTGQKLRIGIASFLDTSMTIYQAICDAFPGAEFRQRGLHRDRAAADQVRKRAGLPARGLPSCRPRHQAGHQGNSSGHDRAPDGRRCPARGL